MEIEHFEDMQQNPQIQLKTPTSFDFPYEINGEILKSPRKLELIIFKWTARQEFSILSSKQQWKIIFMVPVIKRVGYLVEILNFRNFS